MDSSKKSQRKLLLLEAHYRVIVSVIVAVVVWFFAFKAQMPRSSLVLVTWMGFALSANILDWIIILSSHPEDFKKINTLEDSSRSLLFIIVIGAAVVSLVAILFLLKSTKGESHEDIRLHILLAIAAVIVSWWLVHTIFSMRYAHMYYETFIEDGTRKLIGGLEFPREPLPDFLDFVYFSFVLGMTFQVADVNITGRKMRRLVLVHGLIAFAFNTSILALSINIISGLVAQ